MEPDVLRLYASTPPPLDEGGEEDEDDFGDFGTFGGVPNSLSFTELDTPLSFDPAFTPSTSSPPELHGRASCNGADQRTEPTKAVTTDPLTNGGVTELSSAPFSTNDARSGYVDHEFADFSAFSNGHLNQTANQDSEQAPLGPAHCDHLHQSQQSASSEGGASRNEFQEVNTDASLEDVRGRAGDVGHDISDVISDDWNDVTGSSDVTNGHTDGPSSDRLSSTETSLGRPLSNQDSTTTTPPDLGSATPSDLSIATPPDLGSATPPDLSNVTSSEQATPPDLRTSPSLEQATPPDLGSATPPDLSKVTSLEQATPPDLSSALPPDLCISTPPDLRTFTSLEQATPPDLNKVTSLEQATPPDLSKVTSLEQATPPDLSKVTSLEQPTPPDLVSELQDDEDEFGEFGDAQDSFDLPTQQEETLTLCSHPEVQDRPEPGQATPTAFPGSDSFRTFDSTDGWSSFSVQQDGDTWEAFRAEQRLHQPEESHSDTVLSERVQRVFQLTFPLRASDRKDSRVVSLRTWLKPDGEHSSSDRAVWMKLEDVHEAEGLRYVWGGSHCNKALLSSLGIDTRNILFTGQKKQPVIVPMFAAGLGMLEPTKEPVKFVSAAEMITSIGQNPTDRCSENQQESLPPVQFDWSSSGLTNPLDANGSSSVLNLDFFGPVEDSGSAPFTGVDPELFDLTTSKMDDSSSRVLDAFSRLMSTMDRTTSTRKLKQTETLSVEASSVLSSLPDLSFMAAKVLMFPSTLTPITH